MKRARPDVADDAAEGQVALSYCTEFVQGRLACGGTPSSVLREFNVDADAWPSSADSLSAAALADVLVRWVSACRSREEGAESASGRSQPTLWSPVALNATCSWTPASLRVALTAELGCGRDAVCVLDGLVDDALRAELMTAITGTRTATGPAPPLDKWERTTCDGDGLPPTWGLQPSLLEALQHEPPPCVVEVQTRLARLYPEYTLAHLHQAAIEGSEGGRGAYRCTSFVANAAVYGDQFQWHVDADPLSFPPGPWRSTHGEHENGRAGKPLLVSLLVYLDERWRKAWDAETLFLAEEPGVGLLVQPRAARAVLMHADVLHRVSTPSISACVTHTCIHAYMHTCIHACMRAYIRTLLLHTPLLYYTTYYIRTYILQTALTPPPRIS